MRISNDIKSLSSLLISIFVALFGLIFVYIDRFTSIENQFINLAILLAFGTIVFYFIYILKNIKASIPIIICSLCIVFVEPAPCDILIALSIFSFILNPKYYNKAIKGLTLAEYALLLY